MVVDVLITNCQVSEKPNSGPLTAQPRISARHAMKANGLPSPSYTMFANRENIFLINHANAPAEVRFPGPACYPPPITLR